MLLDPLLFEIARPNTFPPAVGCLKKKAKHLPPRLIVFWIVRICDWGGLELVGGGLCFGSFSGDSECFCGVFLRDCRKKLP